MRYLWLVAAALMLAITFGRAEDPYPRRFRSSTVVHIQYQLELIAKSLRAYKEKHGSYPSNDQGLLVLDDIVKMSKDKDPSDGRLTGLRATDSGILSEWGEPFIYENGTSVCKVDFPAVGAPYAEFANVYGIEVDDGVRVWSVGARRALDEAAKVNPSEAGLKVIAVVAAMVFVALFTKAHYRGKGAEDEEYSFVKEMLKWAVVVGVAAFVFCPAFRPTDSQMQPRPLLRDAALTKEYISVMRTYRDRGAISNATFSKLVRALKSDEDSFEYYCPN